MVFWTSLFCPQYLKNFHVRGLPVLERFALLISITVVWAYAHLLTASGAYKHHPEQTQVNCRTDRANLISSAPWLVTMTIFYFSILMVQVSTEVALLLICETPSCKFQSHRIGDTQMVLWNVLKDEFTSGIIIFSCIRKCFCCLHSTYSFLVFLLKQDKDPIPSSMGCAYIWCRSCFRNDGCCSSLIDRGINS